MKPMKGLVVVLMPCSVAERSPPQNSASLGVLPPRLALTMSWVLAMWPR